MNKILLKFFPDYLAELVGGILAKQNKLFDV